MFWFIVAIILFLIALGLFLGKEADGVSLRPWAFGVGALAALLALLSCITTVGAREVGIPVTLGSIGTDLQPGLHLKLPWTEVHSCSLAQQQSIQTQAQSEGDTSGSDGISINGSDQGSAVADTTVLYHFDPLKAQDIYRKYGCNAGLVKQNLIRQALKGAIPAVAAKYPSLEIKDNREAIQDASLAILNADFKGDGIVVDEVILSRIDLSANTQAAADAKLAAQQAAQQAQFTLQKAQIDKQTAEVNAQAQQAANNTQTQSLSPQILCQQWIQAIATAKPSVINSAGPCAPAVVGGTASSTIVQVP